MTFAIPVGLIRVTTKESTMTTLDAVTLLMMLTTDLFFIFFIKWIRAKHKAEHWAREFLKRAERLEKEYANTRKLNREITTHLNTIKALRNQREAAIRQRDEAYNRNFETVHHFENEIKRWKQRLDRHFLNVEKTIAILQSYDCNECQDAGELGQLTPEGTHSIIPCPACSSASPSPKEDEAEGQNEEESPSLFPVLTAENLVEAIREVETFLNSQHLQQKGNDNVS